MDSQKKIPEQVQEKLNQMLQREWEQDSLELPQKLTSAALFHRFCQEKAQTAQTTLFSAWKRRLSLAAACAAGVVLAFGLFHFFPQLGQLTDPSAAGGQTGQTGQTKEMSIAQTTDSGWTEEEQGSSSAALGERFKTADLAATSAQDQAQGQSTVLYAASPVPSAGINPQSALEQEAGAEFSEDVGMENAETPSYEEIQETGMELPLHISSDAPVLQTNGAYIYSLEREQTESIVKIIDAETLDTASVIRYDSNVVDIDWIYCYEDSLVLLDTDRFAAEKDSAASESFKMGFTAYIYDVSDGKSPREIAQFSQTGELLQSVSCNGVLYLLANSSAIPLVSDGEKEERLSSSQVQVLSVTEEKSYVTVAALPFQQPENHVVSAFSGYRAEKGLWSESDLYLLSQTGQRDSEKEDTFSLARLQVQEDGLTLSPDGMVEGKGYMTDFQRSLDGRLYGVAECWGEEEGVRAYVWDSSLQQVGGALFPQEEMLWGVNFRNSYAYLSFEGGKNGLIDFSNPQKPVFSWLPEQKRQLQNLYSLTETAAAGISMDPDTGAFYLAVYDVSSPERMVELDAVPLTGSVSWVLEHFSEFFYSVEGETVFGFPIEWEDQGAFCLISLEENQFVWQLFAEGLLPARGILLGDRLYTVTREKIVLYAQNSGEFQREKRFSL